MISMVRKSQARQLLHNKFVVILGGPVQRSMYKDLVVLLQMDHHLTLSQLKSKVSHLGPTLCYDIIEANFYSMKLADFIGLDVMDLHFYFRHSLHYRMQTGSTGTRWPTERSAASCSVMSLMHGESSPTVVHSKLDASILIFSVTLTF